MNIANTTSAKAIADFKSGNTSRLFVRADGNVGIGTAAPFEKVRVALVGNANAKTGTNAFGSSGLTYLQFDTTTTNNEVGIFGGEGI